MRVAVIGAGVSGLVSAHLLSRAHDVVVYEANDYPGGHTCTVDVPSPGGSVAVDTGFIVFNDRNYPGFERLLARLGVASQPSEMSFSVSDGGGFEYSGAGINGLLARRRHAVSPAFWRMVVDLARFNRAARELLHNDGDDPGLAEWLERMRFSRWFVERLIVPQVSAVWSADPRQVWSFPARFLARFLDNHGMLGFRDRPRWRTVAGGSARYVDALVAPLGERLRLSEPVRSVRREADHVTVTSPRHGAERFDEVVLATHSDQALALLEDPTPPEREVLGAIPYQPNEVVLHTDTRLLPRRRRAWASWNYHLTATPSERATLTYHMNRLQALHADRDYCVTLNHTAAIDPSQVIRTAVMSHPVFTPAGVAAQARHGEISGVNRTSYCGAYWSWGFHEDGVGSALRVGSRFGVTL